MATILRLFANHNSRLNALEKEHKRLIKAGLLHTVSYSRSEIVEGDTTTLYWVAGPEVDTKCVGRYFSEVHIDGLVDAESEAAARGRIRESA